MSHHRIIIADDHAVVRSGLRMLLERKGFQVVAEASQGLEALALTRELQPDFLLLDLTMPPGPDGLEIARELRHFCPRVQIVVLTMHEDPALERELLEAGAQAYVLKQAPEGVLFATLSELAQKADSPRSHGITLREREVLGLFAQGYSNKEIAKMLEISVKTVESHRSNLYLKLGFVSKAELVSYALSHGILLANP